eukprot:ANDGO_03141.mRNA.1 hypothetical protein
MPCEDCSARLAHGSAPTDHNIQQVCDTNLDCISIRKHFQSFGWAVSEEIVLIVAKSTCGVPCVLFRMFDLLKHFVVGEDVELEYGAVSSILKDVFLPPRGPDLVSLDASRAVRYLTSSEFVGQLALFVHACRLPSGSGALEILDRLVERDPGMNGVEFCRDVPSLLHLLQTTSLVFAVAETETETAAKSPRLLIRFACPLFRKMYILQRWGSAYHGSISRDRASSLLRKGLLTCVVELLQFCFSRDIFAKTAASACSGTIKFLTGESHAAVYAKFQDLYPWVFIDPDVGASLGMVDSFLDFYLGGSFHWGIAVLRDCESVEACQQRFERGGDFHVLNLNAYVLVNIHSPGSAVQETSGLHSPSIHELHVHVSPDFQTALLSHNGTNLSINISP